MDATEPPPRSRFGDWRRRLSVARWRGIKQIEHQGVVDHAHEEGALTGRFIFMNVMSCGIAILGLLLSSPAVIIGAMLISPLMGPIMLMGFSLAILDLKALRQAVVSLAAGMAVALATSFLIVFVSPLTDTTPEILARARPNFFDLLVAVFSGLAGGYAIIHRKGETIVGVAIATALMPPLAVVGFGLASGHFEIAGGAFFLFMTNLLAIALSVTMIARFYGFGGRHSSKHAAWQTAIIVIVFVALSIPLGLSLRDIAYEARVRDVAQDMLVAPFQDQGARVTDFDVTFPRQGDSRINVRATVLTPVRVPAAEAGLAAQLTERFGRPVAVVVDQVIVDDDNGSESARLAAIAESSFGAPMRAQAEQLDVLASARRTERELRAAFPYMLSHADIDSAARRAVFSAGVTDGVGLSAFRRLEEGLARNFPDWEIQVNPPRTELLVIEFAEGSDDLTPERSARASDIAWALQRWGATQAEVVASLPTAAAARAFDEQSAGHRRATSVASELAKAGIRTRVAGEYRASDGSPAEQEAAARRTNQIVIRPAG